MPLIEDEDPAVAAKILAQVVNRHRDSNEINTKQQARDVVTVSDDLYKIMARRSRDIPITQDELFMGHPDVNRQEDVVIDFGPSSSSEDENESSDDEGDDGNDHHNNHLVAEGTTTCDSRATGTTEGELTAIDETTTITAAVQPVQSVDNWFQSWENQNQNQNQNQTTTNNNMSFTGPAPSEAAEAKHKQCVCYTSVLVCFVVFDFVMFLIFFFYFQ